MSLILTSEDIKKMPVQAVFTAWNYSNEEGFISPLRNKWFIKRAYKKLDSGADFGSFISPSAFSYRTFIMYRLFKMGDYNQIEFIGKIALLQE